MTSHNGPSIQKPSHRDFGSHFFCFSGFWAALKKNSQDVVSPQKWGGIRIWMFPKIVGFPTQIINFNRVFHDFHHPFWGPAPIFWKQPDECQSSDGRSQSCSDTKRPSKAPPKASLRQKQDQLDHDSRRPQKTQHVIYAEKKKQHGQVVDLLFRDKVVQCVLVQASGNWRNYCSVLGR